MANLLFQNLQKYPVADIVKILQDSSLDDLQSIFDIGPKVAQSIYDWFHNQKSILFLEKLERIGVRILDSSFQILDSKLRGKSFVFTGSLVALERENAKEKIRALGGDVNESVSKNTTYVVAGENPGSKALKAKKLGVAIIEEREFLKIVA